MTWRRPSELIGPNPLKRNDLNFSSHLPHYLELCKIEQSLRDAAGCSDAPLASSALASSALALLSPPLPSLNEPPLPVPDAHPVLPRASVQRAMKAWSTEAGGLVSREAGRLVRASLGDSLLFSVNSCICDMIARAGWSILPASCLVSHIMILVVISRASIGCFQDVRVGSKDADEETSPPLLRPRFPTQTSLLSFLTADEETLPYWLCWRLEDADEQSSPLPTLPTKHSHLNTPTNHAQQKHSTLLLLLPPRFSFLNLLVYLCRTRATLEGSCGRPLDELDYVGKDFLLACLFSSD
jgi:hypothetical protein